MTCVHRSKVLFNLLINDRNSGYYKPVQKRSQSSTHLWSDKECSNKFINRCKTSKTDYYSQSDNQLHLV